MIKFFRKIRKKLADDNEFLKYSRYAVGEIALVVIGILIALAINNWNEEQKFDRTQSNILNDILQSVDNDLNRFEAIYSRRLERKREAIDTLIYFIGSDVIINDSIFMSYFNFISNDILVSFDSGPYEALKSTGLNKIKNDSLRMEVVRTYEVVLPVFMDYSNSLGTQLNPKIVELRHQIIESQVIKNSNGEFVIKDYPRINNVLQSPILVIILELENRKYRNFRNRIRFMEYSLKRLQSRILIELEKP